MKNSATRFFTDLGKSSGAIETRLSEWGADDDEEESESENGGNTKKGLTDKKKKDFGF